MHIQRQQENFAYRVAANPVRDLIHYTYPNHVPEIMANGFHAGRGEGGYGVYFTPAGVDYPDLNYGEHVPIHAQFQPTKTLMMTGDDGDPGYQKYVEATYRNYHRPDIPLAEQGYDSVEYHDRWGATQFIVLDPTKIKTIGPIGPESPHYIPPRKIKSGNTIRCAADLIKDYTDSLYKEFHDWIDNDQGGVWPVGGSRPADYTQGMGGPLSYWDNIEAFLEDRYPAVHRGYRYGEEQVAPTLDGYGISFPRYQRPVPYETGPEAISKYGYDPRQVAAGFMYLHSTAHNTAHPTDRADRIPRDIDRLSDIFQKRVDMQEDYKQRKTVNANTIRCAADVPSLTDMWKHFTTWVGGTEEDAVAAGQEHSNIDQFLDVEYGLHYNPKTQEDIDAYWDHPMMVQMNKIHAFLQGREDVENLADSELLEGAALGLVKLRKDLAQKQLTNSYSEWD